MTRVTIACEAKYGRQQIRRPHGGNMSRITDRLMGSTCQYFLIWHLLPGDGRIARLFRVCREGVMGISAAEGVADITAMEGSAWIGNRVVGGSIDVP